MRLNSIRVRALLALTLICVAIVSIMGGLWLYTTSQDIKRTVSSADLQDIKLMGDYVRMYVESVETSEELAGLEPETINALDENNPAPAMACLDVMAASTPQDDVVFLIDSDGTTLYHTYAMNDTPGSHGVFIDLRKNTTYVTDIFYSPEFGDHVFAVVSPVMEDGSVIGFIYDEVRPSDLYAFMERELGGYVDHVLLVDGTGRVILQDDRSQMEQHADLSGYLPVKKALAGETGVVEHVGLDNSATISAHYPINETGWGLVISTRADRAYRPILDHALKILGTCLPLIVALTVLGYLASRYLMSPIERLSGAMQRVSEGDYDVSLKGARKDELGDLERSFNALVGEVRKRDESVRTEKERSEFYLDLMSHDINNMNHAGMGFLEMAIDGLKGRVGEQEMVLVGKAYEALENSSALIDNMRKLKKARAGLRAPEELDLGLLLAEAKEKYVRYPGRDVTINYSPASCKVRACGLFREVFFNIVENAIKHSDPSMPLVISLSLSREKHNGVDYCRASIEDNGPGIPDEMKEAVFNRFRRGPKGGSGLGLHIVKMLVEEFGGKVWAEDRVEGDHSQGARFVVLMPAAG